LRWFIELIGTSHESFARRGGLADAARALIERIDYRSEIRRKFAEESERQARWESIGEVLNMLAQYERGTSAPSLGGFLDQIALESRDDEKDRAEEKKDAVTLMTLHSAKGLEFPHVYLVGLENGILPHERSMQSRQGIAEERRLAYVGVTRARDRLTLTRACHRTRFGRRQAVEASMFLPEMFGRAEATPADPPPPTSAVKRRRPARR
jgi:DNA helicase-2/ATP-dependent DNA helicase PcrA